MDDDQIKRLYRERLIRPNSAARLRRRALLIMAAVILALMAIGALALWWSLSGVNPLDAL